MIYYLIIVNLLGAILYVINSKFLKNKLDLLLMIIATLGGVLGIIVTILLFDCNINKQNTLVKIYSICILIIEVIMYLLFKRGLNFDVGFLYENYWLVIYLILINIISFIIFGIDKYKAKKHRYRISLATLFTICFLGGSLGGIVGMYAFNHKVNKNYFVIGLPMILVMHIAIIYYLGCIF